MSPNAAARGLLCCSPLAFARPCSQLCGADRASGCAVRSPEHPAADDPPVPPDHPAVSAADPAVSASGGATRDDGSSTGAARRKYSVSARRFYR